MTSIQFAMCGSSGKYNPYEATEPLRRQRILFLINSGSRKTSEIARELDINEKDVEKDINALRTCGLVKKVKSGWSPSFAIFTLDDQKALDPLLRGLSKGTVEIIKGKLSELRVLIDELECTRRGLSFPDLEYIIVGAITLDYGALDVLKDDGLLIPRKKMPGGGNCVFSGYESGLIALRKQWMWGHNYTFDNYWFSTHGRLPPKGPRIAFPDVAYQWSRHIGLDKVKRKMKEIGDILSFLSKENLSLTTLSEKTRRREKELLIELTLLGELDYVTSEGDKWKLSRPFFSEGDLRKVDGFSKSILKDISEYLKRRLPRLKNLYEQTSPSRNGIPLLEAFNGLYHQIFEEALNTLIENEVIRAPLLRRDKGKYSPFVGVEVHN